MDRERMNENRSVERFILKLSVNIKKENTVAESAWTKDISSNGVFVLTPNPLEPGSRVNLEVKLPFRSIVNMHEKNILKVRGKVLRVDKGGMAIFFEGMDDFYL